MSISGIRHWEQNVAITLNRQLQTPIWHQLVDALIREIRRRRFSPGAVLPSSRELAVDLGINRKTVTNAYDELVAQGWLTSDPKRGMFVSTVLPEDDGDGDVPPSLATRGNIRHLYAISDEITDSPMVTTGVGSLSFDDGAPDSRLLPAEALARSYRSSLISASRSNSLQYGDPRGLLRLREAIASMLKSHRGLAVEPENVCLTRGSQMAIFLTTRTLVTPGQRVALEELSYPPVVGAFTMTGASVCPVRLDAEGIDVDHLEYLCKQEAISSIYLTPQHQYPTTVTLSPERRLKLLSIAEQYKFSIIEDDYDNEFNFDAKPLPAIAGFSLSNTVYVGSFSKMLAPSFRLGYIVASKPTIDAMAKQIVTFDRHGDMATEAAVADLMETGELQRHIRRARNIYRSRREGFVALLRSHFEDRIRFVVPEGGLAMWVEFADPMDLATVQLKALSRQFHLLTSESFIVGNSERRGLRLGFGSKDPREAAAAMHGFRQLLD
ncbi:PLP-dependent aminotransferase family protein [Paraburkholderia sp. GAS42]|uniref:MocR-like pyridoxine biosynthesis transcription factor PdxR n=1 Tax=Paraburkholderia sp. GAS42 TaxID=3035135 RepID=UPI003D1E280D